MKLFDYTVINCEKCKGELAIADQKCHCGERNQFLEGYHVYVKVKRNFVLYWFGVFIVLLLILVINGELLSSNEYATWKRIIGFAILIYPLYAFFKNMFFVMRIRNNLKEFGKYIFVITGYALGALIGLLGCVYSAISHNPIGFYGMLIGASVIVIAFLFRKSLNV